MEKRREAMRSNDLAVHLGSNANEISPEGGEDGRENGESRGSLIASE